MKMPIFKTPRPRASEKGFTLVEITISMVIIGFLLSMGALLIPRLAAEFQEAGTYERMDRIHKAMSAYVQKYNRVPCPAEPNQADTTQPFGTERGSGGGGNNFGSCPAIRTRHGIVPFRTLGLTLEDAKDSFGNFFTYKVSGTSSRVRNAGAEYINNWCRTDPVWYNGADIDPEKAAFCCGSLPNNNINFINQDLQIEGPFGAMPQSMRTPNYGGLLAEYSRTIDPVPTSVNLIDTFRPTPTAYVLISHGRNGIGSYTDTGLQRPGQFRSNLERFNTLNTTRRVFVQDNVAYNPTAADPGTGVKQRIDRNRNDDIVSWMSVAQVYAYTGNASCMEPR